MEQEKVRAWLEIDPETVRSNFRAIRKNVNPLKVFAVIKADAYGMGAKCYAELLKQEGAAGFCTATLEEALELKPFGLPVQILGPVTDDELPEAVANDIVLGIFDAESAEKISRESVRQNKKTQVHFKIDTDMGRTGILEREAPFLIRKLSRLPGLDCKGIYTHFPLAERDNPETLAQTARFRALLEVLAVEDILPEIRHIANSDAINSVPMAAEIPLTHVRAGIDLHGGFTPDASAIGLKPVFAMKAKILAVREMPKGHNIGYNRTCTLTENTRTAVVAAGYADGIPLALSNRGFLRIKGKLCPVLGRVSMDCTTVSLAPCGDTPVKPGDEAVFLDGLSPETSVEHWAELKGTHAYDILCSIGHRVKRIYKENLNS